MLDREGIETRARELREDGVTAVEGYLAPETCEEIYGLILDAIEDEEFAKATDEMTYADKAGRGSPLLDRRSGGVDDGMIDIFHLDQVVPEVASIKNDGTVLQVINRAADAQFSPDNINTYYNRSVTNTRDYHADTFQGKFKSFVYLTDVPDESYGPFSYVRGTHDKPLLERKLISLLNRVEGNHPTDARGYDESRVETFVAPKGTLIIANQAGYHRGIPQEPGKERMLLTTSYTREGS